MPWTLSGCDEANPSESVFLQAVILNKSTGALSEYDPLVITQGTQPAAPPVSINIGQNEVVGIFGGGNDDVTVLLHNNGNCVQGVNGTRFGQVFFCGTQSLFSAFDTRPFNVPTIGVSNTGEPCPTTRSFQIVDQDQSDNVQTLYLAAKDGRIAQDNAANRAILGTYTVLRNGSDNTLMSEFVDPAIKCSSWSIPNVSSDLSLTPTQFTNEEQARHYQKDPVALIPIGDPMTRTLSMTNAYRLAVDQHYVVPLPSKYNADTIYYCEHLLRIAPMFFSEHSSDFANSPSPQPGVDLGTFLNNRYQASLSLLAC